MSNREFNWVDYEVSVPAPVAREMRWLATAQAAAPGVEVPGAPPEILLSIPLPDLNGHPTPRDKAKILLDSAAEVEHALMVQYLYAAYSLKGSDEAPPEFQDVLDEGFSAVLASDAARHRARGDGSFHDGAKPSHLPGTCAQL